MMAKIMRSIALFFHNRYVAKIVVVLTILLSTISLSLALRSFYLHMTLVPIYEQKLQKRLAIQIGKINVFLDENKAKADELSNDPVILDHLEKILLKQTTTPAAEQRFSDYLAKRQENIGFKSLSFIANDSTVLYSTNPLLRRIQFDELYSDTPLYKSYYIASMTLASDFSDFNFSATIKEPAFYITMPIISKNKILGVLAYQVDEKHLITITRDYLDLGATGEIVLAVQSGQVARFITPTRNAPSIRFTTKELFTSSSLEKLQRAARGETGVGRNIDYLGKETLAAWSFIPRVDWAIVVKINLDEVLEPISWANKYLIIFAILALGFATLAVSLYYKGSDGRMLTGCRRVFRHIPMQIRYPEILLLIIFLVLSVFSIYRFKHRESMALKESQDLAIYQIRTGITQIKSELKKISLLADFIAQDLRTERLISEDIRKRLRREIVETEGLVRITIAYAPYQYSQTQRLHAQSITQKEDGLIVEEKIEDLYDYTDENEGILKTGWYISPMQSQKAQWLNPSVDPLSKQQVIIYAMPFYFDQEEKPAGVIAISYKLPIFAEVARNIGVGETGYAFITSFNEEFLYHPILENVFRRKTLSEFAQEEGIEELQYIAQEIKLGKPILKKFSDESMRYPSWIYTHPISETGWTIATVFSTNEIGLPAGVTRAYIFDIILYLSISVLLALALLCRFYSQKPWASFLNFSNFVLLIILICFWCTIYSEMRLEKTSHVLVTAQSSVNKFVNRQMQEALRKNDPSPVIIPCGIELYSLRQTSPTDVMFSGFIWHRYHKTMHKDIQRLIRIPQATSFEVLNSTQVSEGDWEIIGLNVTVNMYHELDYTDYPFEKHQIEIPLEHADIGKNILLVPDLADYTSIFPFSRPGLDTSFSKNAFHVIETFFDYVPHKPKSGLGVREYLEKSDRFRLTYNAIVDTDLLAAFIYFFLPLLVILISIFAVLILERPATSPETMIGPYTGLFFALVLLHRSLHEAAPASNTLYIEYAFFYTYIILILLVIHSILVQRFAGQEFYQEKVVYFLKVIFWPLQLFAWVVTTLIMFR